MSKCPYCHFENEAGALFCEQCKSDLGWTEPTIAQPMAVSETAESIPEAASRSSDGVGAGRTGACCSHRRRADRGGGHSVADASPVLGLAEPVAEQTSEQHTPAPESPTLQNGMPSHQTSTPSTIDQVMPPGLADKIPPGSKPKLIVLRGQRQNIEYPIYEGDNYIGRADDKAVDVDLEDQEPPDRIWSSRQHAVISYEGTALTIEDLNSTNGTYLNRTRIEAGKKIPLTLNDVIQIGTVQLRVVL